MIFYGIYLLCEFWRCNFARWVSNWGDCLCVCVCDTCSAATFAAAVAIAAAAGGALDLPQHAMG